VKFLDISDFGGLVAIATKQYNLVGPISQWAVMLGGWEGIAGLAESGSLPPGLWFYLIPLLASTVLVFVFMPR